MDDLSFKINFLPVSKKLPFLTFEEVQNNQRLLLAHLENSDVPRDRELAERLRASWNMYSM